MGHCSEELINNANMIKTIPVLITLTSTGIIRSLRVGIFGGGGALKPED
jgi:hypothetical protein